jgi:plastocyanin
VLTTLQRLATAVVIAFLCLVEATPSSGAANQGAVEGQIRVSKDGKRKSSHGNVIVYLEGVPASAVTAETKHVIRQRDVQFEPRISIVVKGTTVEFPNNDKIFHNVFSTSRPARFDLGLYRDGASKSVPFKREGVVDVFCNIHPEMSARVFVVPNSHFATTDASGKFRIAGVPAGTYPVVAWEAHGNAVRGKVTIASGKVATVTLDIAEGAPAEEHRRKDGTPYGRYE